MGELWECVIWWERTDRIITFKQSADYPLWYLNNRAAAAAARERETERIIFMKSNFFFFFVVRCFVWEQKKNRKKKKGRKTAVESSPPPQHVKFLWQSPTNASRARKAWFFCFFFSWNFFFSLLNFFRFSLGEKDQRTQPAQGKQLSHSSSFACSQYYRFSFFCSYTQSQSHSPFPALSCANTSIISLSQSCLLLPVCHDVHLSTSQSHSHSHSRSRLQSQSQSHLYSQSRRCCVQRLAVFRKVCPRSREYEKYPKYKQASKQAPWRIPDYRVNQKKTPPRVALCLAYNNCIADSSTGQSRLEKKIFFPTNARYSGKCSKQC